MNYDKIIYQIIKLDKSVYLDLISVPASLQRALAIWVASATISLLGILSLFNATVDYIAEELPLFTQMLVQSGASEEDISSFNEAIGFLIDLPPGLSPSVTSIAGQVFFGLVGLAIQIGIIYLIAAVISGAIVLIASIRLLIDPSQEKAWTLFKISSPYLAVLFLSLIHI